MSLQYAILGLLDTFGDMSGYDLKNRFSQSVSNIWEADLSQIYRTLDRLEAAELVSATQDPDSNRGRKIYAITEAGRTDLRQWVQQDLQLETIRNPGMLQIFFSRRTPPERFRQQVIDYREKFIQLADGYDEIDQLLQGLMAQGWEDAFFQHLTLMLGKRYTDMTIDWCNDILQRLDERYNTNNISGETEHE